MSAKSSLKRSFAGQDRPGQLRSQEEGSLTPSMMILKTTEQRNEFMKQTVLQEFENCLNVHDFGTQLVNFNRDNIDPNSIVISCKDGLLLEPAGTVLTLAWDDDKVSLCVDKPGDATINYANNLCCRLQDEEDSTQVLQSFADVFGHLHLQLNEKLHTCADWRIQFLPFVIDMTTLVFRHSLFRLSMFNSYGSRNVHLCFPPVFAPFMIKNEVLEMVMIISSPASGISLRFYEEGLTPSVSISPITCIDDPKNRAMMRAIKKLWPNDATSRYFIAKARQGYGWHVRLPFRSPEDMRVLLQTVKISLS
jgi:hypothetical protein